MKRLVPLLVALVALGSLASGQLTRDTTPPPLTDFNWQATTTGQNFAWHTIAPIFEDTVDLPLGLDFSYGVSTIWGYDSSELGNMSIDVENLTPQPWFGAKVYARKYILGGDVDNGGMYFEIAAFGAFSNGNRPAAGVGAGMGYVIPLG